MKIDQILHELDSIKEFALHKNSILFFVVVKFHEKQY